MSEPVTLADLAFEIRSKNAGPFWMTIELFLRDAGAYELVADPRVINEGVIAELYRIGTEHIRIFRIPDLHVVKVSFPRPIAQGGLRDRDLHRGQHHVPLAELRLPAAR